MKLKVEYIPIDSITPYENNAKIHTDEQIEQIKRSIEEFGMNDPIGIWKDNIIIEGHGRLMACKELGMEEVPIIRLDNLTDDQRKAYTLIHNQTTMNTGFDLDILNEELENIEIDMSDFGFDEIELDDIEEEQEIVEDEVPDVPEEPKAKLGDIYQLGNHRLMCGDSTSIDDVEKLLDGNEIDLVLTDPPYGVDIVQGAKVGGDKPFGKGTVGITNVCKANEYIPIKGDETTDTAKDFFNLISQMSKVQIIFGGNYFTDFLYPSRCWIVWDKESPSDNYFADVELAWVSLDHNAKLYRWLWNGMCKKGDKKTEGIKRVHPTQKPVGLLGEILKDFSKENDVIFDGFGGSGSTLIACEQLNRKCYMMEYEPHYIDVIIERWENFTGKKAIKL